MTLLCPASRLNKPAGFVYVLSCVGDRFYVGFTKHFATRMEQHWSGEGAEFTKRWEPLKVVLKVPAEDERHEYAIFKQYVSLYGLHRVGGWNKILAGKFGFIWPYKVKDYFVQTKKKSKSRK